MSIHKFTKLSMIVLSTVVIASCASTSHTAEDYSAENVDRFETYNRAMFKFNYEVDKYVIRPVAEGYRAITNQFIRNRVNSALDNLKEPVWAGNYVLQAEPEKGAKSLARFAINSTLGLAGTFDVAQGWGLEKEKTSFNETFAKWCIPSGPYIVLPIVGPSTPRAATSLALGFVFDPVYWATINDANIHDKVAWGYAALDGIATRESALELLDDLERNSVDFYTTMRSAYMQNQSKLKCFCDDNSQTNTYDFDFGIEEEDEAFDMMEDEQ